MARFIDDIKGNGAGQPYSIVTINQLTGESESLIEPTTERVKKRKREICIPAKADESIRTVGLPVSTKSRMEDVPAKA